MKKENNIKGMRHEVIELAINLENFLDEEIMTYFGLDAWDASYHMQIERSRDIFLKFFLRYMAFPKKFHLIGKMVKNIGEELYDKFGTDTQKFIEIRNKFAHTFYPEIDKESMPKMKIEIIKTQQKDWKKMYKEAKILYTRIINELDSKFYSKETRARKYKRFDERYLQKVIERYELLLKEGTKK